MRDTVEKRLITSLHAELHLRVEAVAIMPKPSRLLTIGYSPYPVEDFLKILKIHSITALVDVRAYAASTTFDCYNAEKIGPLLNDNGIKYLHMGRELGARPRDDSLFTNGKVDFKKLAASADFLNGCQRLKNGLDKGYNICLMCAQKDPLNCHRAVLITRYFIQKYPETEILHIWPGHAETQRDVDNRLLGEYKKGLYKNSLMAFDSGRNEAQMLEEAYAKRSWEIAWERR